jgi:nicotinamidase-related amidase
VPVWGTTENTDKLGPNVPEVQAAIEAAGGKTLAKMHFSAVADGLGDWLRPPVRKAPAGGNARSLPKHLQKAAPPPAAARESIVLAGCEAHVCLLQTALELIEEGKEVFVVADAVGSRREQDRDLALARMRQEGARIVSREMVVFEWLGEAATPLFREIHREFLRG